MNSDPVFQRINTLLEDKNVMQKDLINFLGMARGTYVQWKKGACHSYRSHLSEISKFFEVPICFLTDGVQEEVFDENSKACILSKTEYEMIKLFREMPPNVKSSIFQMLEYLNEK